MIVMKITYVWTGDLNYITNRRSYRFNASNKFTVDVSNYEDLYTMIRDSRHGTSLKLDKDPSIDKSQRYTRPGILTMASNGIPLWASMVITTKTASGKDKVQEVKDLDKIIDDVVLGKPDEDTKETLKETKKKVVKSIKKKK